MFSEIKYNNTFILIISKAILILFSLSVSLFPLIVIACYVFDIWILPMKTWMVLMDWYFPAFKEGLWQVVLSCTIDIVCFGLGIFLGATYASNFSAVIHLFMTDAIGKLEL